MTARDVHLPRPVCRRQALLQGDELLVHSTRVVKVQNALPVHRGHDVLLYSFQGIYLVSILSQALLVILTEIARYFCSLASRFFMDAAVALTVE